MKDEDRMFYMIFERCKKKFKSPTPSAKKTLLCSPSLQV
jgi:hypothetical protein